MLVVKELSKKIGHKQILNNINLNIPKGSIYGIIGENGAGKTTLIRHLVGVYQGDTGFVELDGMRVYENPETKARMVYIPDEFFDVFGRNIRYSLRRVESHQQDGVRYYPYPSLSGFFRVNVRGNCSVFYDDVRSSCLNNPCRNRNYHGNRRNTGDRCCPVGCRPSDGHRLDLNHSRSSRSLRYLLPCRTAGLRILIQASLF